MKEEIRNFRQKLITVEVDHVYFEFKRCRTELPVYEFATSVTLGRNSLQLVIDAIMLFIRKQGEEFPIYIQLSNELISNSHAICILKINKEDTDQKLMQKCNLFLGN